VRSGLGGFFSWRTQMLLWTSRAGRSLRPALEEAPFEPKCLFFRVFPVLISLLVLMNILATLMSLAAI
jgi:hypothetical protein